MWRSWPSVGKVRGMLVRDYWGSGASGGDSAGKWNSPGFCCCLCELENAGEGSLVDSSHRGGGGRRAPDEWRARRRWDGQQSDVSDAGDGQGVDSLGNRYLPCSQLNQAF